jgi:hypothetical protein
MTEEEIEYALYHMPEHADYAVDASDLDEEDIEPKRVEILKNIISVDIDNPANNYRHFSAARILCCWGYRCGFDMISKYVFREDLMEGPGEIAHRIYGYNTGYEHAFMAIWTYHATMCDRKLEKESRNLIYDATKKIIEYCNVKLFEINRLFSSLKYYKYEEYYPLIKNHLIIIIEYPEFHDRKIGDAINFLNEVDPEFVASVLQARGKTIADYK